MKQVGTPVPVVTDPPTITTFRAVGVLGCDTGAIRYVYDVVFAGGDGVISLGNGTTVSVTSGVLYTGPVGVTATRLIVTNTVGAVSRLLGEDGAPIIGCGDSESPF